MAVARPEPYVLAHGPNQARNCWGPEYALKFQAVVIHIMAGTLAGCDGWFNTPNNGNNTTRVSYGVGTMPSGRAEIHEYTSPTSLYRPYAHGIVNPPNTPDFQALHKLNNYKNPNYWAIGIEHGGWDLSDTFRDAPDVFELSTSLCAWLCDLLNIPADSAHILGHFEIDGLNRQNCPGLSLPEWDTYINTVRTKLGGTPVAGTDAALRNHVNFSDRLEQDLDAVKNGILVPFGDQPVTQRRQLVYPALSRIVSSFNLGADPATGVYPLELRQIK